MKKYPLILVVLIFTFNSCKSNEEPKTCIDQVIQEFKREAICDSGSKVKQYIFQDETVYVLKEGFCGADFQDEVLDKDCNTIGYLGGISGNFEINGENFNTAQFVTTLWEQ